MSRKYARLTVYLEQQIADRLTLPFAEIERIVGFELPNSARKHDPWWTNSRSLGRHNEAWLNVGWETTDLNMKAQTIAFLRAGPTEAVRRQSGAEGLRPAARVAFDRSTLTETDLLADCAITLQLRWQRLGAVILGKDHKLIFPAAPAEAGLYRIIVRMKNLTSVYVGEAVKLKRRFGNYRLPGSTQKTSVRINALLVETLAQGGSVAVDIVYENMGLSIGGVSIDADLTDKAVRRMIEHAAIVAHGGIDVEMLNC